MSSQEMVVCVANGCSNKPCKDLSFFNFPENKEQRARWIAAIQKPEGWQPSPNAKICSVHFVTRTVSPYPWHPDYVPSVFRSLRTKKRDKSSRARQIIEAELGLDDKGGDGSDDSRKKKTGSSWRAAEEVSVQNEDSFDAPRPTVGRKKKITDAALLSESKRKLKQMEMSDVDFYEEDQMSVQSGGLFDSHDDDSLLEAVAEVKPKRGRGRGRGRGRRGVGGRGSAAAARDQGLTEDGKCRNCQNYVQQIAVLQEELNAKKAIVSEWDDMVKEKSKLFKIKLDHYKGELQNVKDKLSALELNEDFFKKNKHRIMMYTGFPNYSVLITLFNLVNAAVKHDRHIYCITPFQKFILCLMRLKMNLKFKDLANRFAIDLCKIERFFPKWIDALHRQVSHVLVWPPDNVQYRLSVLSQSLREHYRIIKDVVPVTKFISSDGHIRKNHKIEIVCAALLHISEVAVSEVQDQLPDVLASKEDTLVNYLKAVGKYMPPPPPPPPPAVDNVDKTEPKTDIKDAEEEKSSKEICEDEKTEEMDCETHESSPKVDDAANSNEAAEFSKTDEQSNDVPVPPETSSEEPATAETCAASEGVEPSDSCNENLQPTDPDVASAEIPAQDHSAEMESDVARADATTAEVVSSDAASGTKDTEAVSAEVASVDAASGAVAADASAEATSVVTPGVVAADTVSSEISFANASSESSHSAPSATKESSSQVIEGTTDDNTNSEATPKINSPPGAEKILLSEHITDESENQPPTEASFSSEVIPKEEAMETSNLSTSGKDSDPAVSENSSIPSVSENSSIPSVSGNSSIPSVSENIPFSTAAESISMPPVSEGVYFSVSTAESVSIPSVSESNSFPLTSGTIFLPDGSNNVLTPVANVTQNPSASEGESNNSSSVNTATAGGSADGNISAALEQMDVDVPESIMAPIVSDASVVTSSVASSMLPHEDLVFSGTDVPSVAADLLSELMDAASSSEGGNAVTEELLNVANAMVANVTSNISTSGEFLGTADTSKMDASNMMSQDSSSSLALERIVGSANVQSSADCTNLEKLHLECQALHEEILDHIEILRDQLPYNTKFTLFETFEEVANCVKAESLTVPSNEVPHKLQCWLTLTKLKLNLDDLDLSYSYNISLDNLKSIFSVFIPAFANEWKDEVKYDSIADEILIKEFSYLSRALDGDEHAWNACRFINLKSKLSSEAPTLKNILYSNSFSEVWGSVGAERSASDLQLLLANELLHLQRIVQQRPVLSEDLLSSCHESFVEYYTSFCDYDSLHDVYAALLPGPKVYSSKSADLSLFSQFLCVLLRLVNNLTKDEILLRLPKTGDSDDTVEQLFNKRDPDVDAIISAWLPWIHSRFMQLVTWPEVQDDGEEFLRSLRQRYRYLQKVDPHLKMQAEAVCTALYNAGHHLYCVTSEDEDELSGDELVDWLF